MANTLSYIGYFHSPSGSADFEFLYSAVFTGSYTSGTPEVLNFLTAANPNGYELNGFVPVGTTTVPPIVSAQLGGYDVNVSAMVNGSSNCSFYTSGGTELSTGAFPAGITGGSILLKVRHRG